MKKLITIFVSLLVSINFASAEIKLNASGLVSTHKHHVALEKEFYSNLSKTTGMKFSVNYNPLDVLGMQMKDTIRLVRTGTFDIVESTVGEISRDDPFLGGIDLIGVSPNLTSLKKSVDAYREVFSKRAEEKFNAKILTLWPYGPQVFYCKKPVKGLASLKGLKVRSYTPAMSAMIQTVGGTPVALSFKEVYPALQRGVADCAITSPTSGNTGNWPEVTTHYFPLGISWSVQAHTMNLDRWKKLSASEQVALTKAFQNLEKGFWDLAKNNTGDADSCNVGGGACKNYKKFNMKLVKPSSADEKLLAKASQESVLPGWGKTCNTVYPECTKVWNDTIGKAQGMKIN
jgi:TRAP-type C4-dicarboxylate transport system substrate-binding protein